MRIHHFAACQLEWPKFTMTSCGFWLFYTVLTACIILPWLNWDLFVHFEQILCFSPSFLTKFRAKLIILGRQRTQFGAQLVCLNYLLICTFAGCSKINLLIFQCYDITLHCISDQMFWAFAQPLDVSTNYWFSFLVKVDGTMWEPPLVLMLGYCPEWSLLSISWNK